MGYLIYQLGFYLVIAFVIGVALGWSSQGFR